MAAKKKTPAKAPAKKKSAPKLPTRYAPGNSYGVKSPKVVVEYEIGALYEFGGEPRIYTDGGKMISLMDGTQHAPESSDRPLPQGSQVTLTVE